VRIGVLLNGRARIARRDREAFVRSVRDAAGEGTEVIETRSLDEIRPALDRLHRARVNVIAVAGGDGALHHAIQPLVKSHWPGKLFLLGGGTLNIVRHAVGSSAAADVTLSHFRARFEHTKLGALPRRALPLLKVRTEGQDERFGFVFGSEMVKNAVELYDRFGGGYEGLSRFLFEAGRGFLFSTPLWKQESWRLDPPPFGVTVEGETHDHDVPRYSAAIACTVDLAIAGGSIRAAGRPTQKGTFSARIIRETKTGALLSMIPSLMRGAPLEGVVDSENATRMSLHGAYTLDGECFGMSTRSPGAPPETTVEPGGELTFVPGI
jgi:hypothetical protein